MIIIAALTAMAAPSAIAGAKPAQTGTVQALTTPALQPAQQRTRPLDNAVTLTGTTRAIPLTWTEQAGNTCLDLAESTGPAVLHFRCHNGDNQRWVEQHVADGYSLIKSYAKPGLCLDVERSTGPAVIAFECRGTDNQLWRRELKHEGWEFRPKSNPGLCLDAEGDGGIRALVWPCHDGLNQRWW
ncbi:RICIN domain-containing protein [Amycolatopsis keratiniphila]|uniref:Arabinogalactan endo-1,4-beta-galactosidase n=1 Tax=Amycolatopsis keratiniphila TaxID=129921 RepID=R4T0K5_9PSEU|nr:RICIN domain-containing protein [Amycolatopsis keratiniphila]AGM05911.1 arabinogalactan endo-1,4-beta-galactosidase [Amycolatopsis keratiniphila]